MYIHLSHLRISASRPAPDLVTEEGRREPSRRFPLAC